VYDNDTRFSAWISNGGAMGVSADFDGGLLGLDGLGRRKRGKRGTPRVRRTAAEKRRLAAIERAAVPVSVPDRVRRPRPIPAASVVLASAPAPVSAVSVPAFDAAAADRFQTAFSAAADSVPPADSVAVLPGGGEDSFVVSAPSDLPPDVSEVVQAAAEGGPDSPLDLQTLNGLGKLRLKKALKSFAKAAAPVASMIGAAAVPAIGGALIGSAGSFLQSRGGAVRGGPAAAASFSISDTLKSVFRDAVARVGDALVDAAGNIVARNSNGRWQQVVPTFTPDVPNPSPAPKPRTGDGGSPISPALLVGGGLVLFLLLSRRR